MSRITLLSAVPVLAAALALSACDRAAEPPAASDAPGAATADAAGTAMPGAHDYAPAITEADFAHRVQVLASDDFQGRAPGGVGEEKTVEWLAAEFERMGLEPGNGDSWFQDVPMVETTADEASVEMTLDVDGEERRMAFGQDMVIGTRTGEARVEIDDSQLVFVGYGVNAPELGWNDYEGVDVKGKTVVMFVNDPGFHVDDEALFEGQRMTYYGRWTYKFEEAARQGAAAALIIHDTAGASYGWDVVKNSWSGPQFDLPADHDPEPRLPAQGWLSADAARDVLGTLGHDLDGLYQAANQPGFKAIELDASMSLDLSSTSTSGSSRNVIARLPGTSRADEAVVYMGHWDHLGVHDNGDIYNGAIDNATGVAGIMEIAEAFASRGQRPERSLVFLAVTLEESGLLGSKYYVAQPAVALEDTVAVINLDAMPVIGRSSDMTVVGLGNSELEDVLEEVLRGQDRTVSAEATPQDGFFFRSDHFNFAKAGVPALYAKGGDNLREGGLEAGAAAQRDYRDVRYHQPADTFDPSWDMTGVIEDLQALYQVGEVLADGDQWPNWREGNPFRANRDRMLESRAD
ncbi:M28 family metallopeptidase [Lysobacter sp. GX 14042]|uniref:M28 family metallopeptidase n=1 Tax=Lysobacter sp. GX 14042 TaxID=2907155 RepID=UPI001F3281E8|nr:M28 family metallopeptidase [Lysobacter sp. GX 14042]MCE7033414.1 M28 family metallopeptidase [Lysobacter sp. GX 14042]